MNKIIEVLKYNNFYFHFDNSKPKEALEGYITISEDKMWFIKRAVLLNHIIIGRDRIGKTRMTAHLKSISPTG